MLSFALNFLKCDNSTQLSPRRPRQITPAEILSFIAIHTGGIYKRRLGACQITKWFFGMYFDDLEKYLWLLRAVKISSAWRTRIDKLPTLSFLVLSCDHSTLF